MLSIPNRAAVCFFGFALTGCMQSMPTAETITRPTMEAFTRLGSWTPWRSSPEQPQPVVVAVQSAPPLAEPVKEQSVPLVVQPQARARPVAQLASSRARPVLPIPTSVAAPAAAAVTPAAAPSSALPAKVVCQTASQPGERVRMECTPVE